MYYYKQMEKLNEYMVGRVILALRQIDTAIETHKLDAVFALVSGGDASTAMMHVGMLHPKFAGVIHIDTLTGITDTETWKTGQPESIATRFVRDYTKTRGIDLVVQAPFTRYEMLIAKSGFPGPAGHLQMYQFLKERAILQAKKAAYKIAGSKKIGFLAGVSTADSARRMGYVEHSRKDGVGVWINPIWDWAGYEVGLIRAAWDVSRNPVSVVFGMSGECGCGSYASPDEANVIKSLYPQQYERIQQWELLVNAAAPLSGINKKYCRWGHSKGKRISSNQLELPLCAGCIGSQANRHLSMRKKMNNVPVEWTQRAASLRED